jgi:DNA-binding NarL/FixJ family response regulator
VVTPRVGTYATIVNSPPDRLAQAVRAAADGEAVLAPSVTRRLIGAVTRPPAGSADGRSPADLLTERELQVLVLLARGLSNARIAAALGLTEANVKSRVNRILTRLGLDNRVQAAVLAHEAGLLDAPPPPGI